MLIVTNSHFKRSAKVLGSRSIILLCYDLKGLYSRSATTRWLGKASFVGSGNSSEISVGKGGPLKKQPGGQDRGSSPIGLGSFTSEVGADTPGN
jgi:hypothetical protein